METIVATPDIRLTFGRDLSTCMSGSSGVVMELAVPSLAGSAGESVATCGEAAGVEKSGRFHLLRGSQGELVAGAAVIPCEGLSESASYELYQELLEVLGGQPLYRVWNFVPWINAVTEGQEHYHSFNAGRCRAFQERFGESTMESHLPSASAVGVHEPHMAVVFLSGLSPVHFFENPLQVPAYRYPDQYGACSPSFARGAVVTCEDGNRRVGYLSGTASIRGHETVSEDDVISQLDITFENIEAVLREMDFSQAFLPESGIEATLRIYLRDPADLHRVRDRFSEKVGADIAAKAVFLKADICRAALKIEIEGLFTDRG